MKTRIYIPAAVISFALALILIPTSLHSGSQDLTGPAPDEVVRIADLKPYQVSHIQVEVVRLTDEDEAKVKDSSGKIRVYFGWKNTHMVKPGEKVTIKGTLDRGLIKEFYATELILENGDRVVLEKD